jgi:Fe-S cluster biogenesis protein NfuA
MDEKLKSIIAKIRPGLQADGGDIELIGVKDGIVSVRLVGACGNCPMS